MIVVDQYPPGAAGGADFLTGAPLGTVREHHRDGSDRLHPEKVIVTDQDVEFMGTVCIGERSVRHLAHIFEMVDRWQVDDLVDAYVDVAKERDELSVELAEAYKTIDLLRALEQTTPKKVYVDADGVEHRSAKAAVSATRRSFALPDAVIARSAEPVADPMEVPA